MRQLFVLFILNFVGFNSFAGLSPLRLSGMPYESAKSAAHHSNFSTFSIPTHTNAYAPFSSKNSAERKKQFLSKLNLNSVTPITKEQLADVFLFIRDTKFLNSGSSLRRLTWLYPDDGCYARASLASYSIVSLPPPSKIFIFGDLVVKTDNSPNGLVDWWYHVAIAYRVDTEVYIIDPALNPLAPTPIKSWTLQMVRDVRLAKLSICDSGTYDPESDCSGSPSIPQETAYYEGQQFLPYEWSRLEELGRDPSKELGDEPPWLSPLAI
jgi:hypothetical protein